MEKQTTEEKKSPVTEKKERVYGKVAVVGGSGSGKSYTAKTADINTTGLINVERKSAPYKREPFKHEGQPKTWQGFIQNLKDYIANPEIEQIIIDSQTEAFSLLNWQMSINFSGWEIPKNYNKQVYEYFEIIKNAKKEIMVLSHDELVRMDDGTKQRRMAVHNKEYEAKVERVFTIVLFTGTRITNSKPNYFLKTFEMDSSTKVPEGMFGDKGSIDTPLEIANDAKFMFDKIKEYYQ